MSSLNSGLNSDRDRGSLTTIDASITPTQARRVKLTENLSSAILARDHGLLVALLAQEQAAELAVELTTAKETRNHAILIKIAPYCPSLITAMTIALVNADYQGAELLERNHWTGVAKRTKVASSETYGQLLTNFLNGLIQNPDPSQNDHTLKWLLNHNPEFGSALRLAALNQDHTTLELILKQAVISSGSSDKPRQLATQAVADLVLTELSARAFDLSQNREARLNQKIQAIKLLCHHGATIEPALETIVDYLVSVNQTTQASETSPSLAQLLLDNLLIHGRTYNSIAAIQSLQASLYQVLQLWPATIVDNILQYLIDQKVPLDGISLPGQTGTIYRHVPLRLAVNLDSTSLVHRLIQAGADPNAYDGLILIDAARNNKLIALRTLLKMGGDPKLVLDCYVTPQSRPILQEFLVLPDRSRSQANVLELLQQLTLTATELGPTELTERPKRAARQCFDKVCGQLEVPVETMDLLDQYLKHLRVQVVKRSRTQKNLVTFRV